MMENSSIVQMHRFHGAYHFAVGKGSSGVFTLRTDVVAMSLPAFAEDFHLIKGIRPVSQSGSEYGQGFDVN
jgi:hypothetical protein